MSIQHGEREQDMGGNYSLMCLGCGHKEVMPDDNDDVQANEQSVIALRNHMQEAHGTLEMSFYIIHEECDPGPHILGDALPTDKFVASTDPD